MKKYLQRTGINNDYLSELLGIPIDSFSIKSVRDGTSLHSEFYVLEINPRKDKPPQLTLFLKDTKEEGAVFSISGDTLYRGGKLAENEIRFLEFGGECRAFTPILFDVKRYQDQKKVSHIIMLMECFDKSLEEKLLGLDRDSADVAFEYARRTIDRILRNSVLTQKHEYATKDRMSYPTIYKTALEDVEPYIKQAINGLLINKFRKHDEKLTLEQYIDEFIEVSNWGTDKKSSEIMRRLLEYVAGPLISTPEEHILLNLDPHPGNTLINDRKLPEYNPDVVLGDDTNRNIVITDNYKFGYGPEALVAVLVSHPAFYRLLTPERIRQLEEHTLLQSEKIKQEEGTDLIDSKKREDFSRRWAAATRFGFLRRINYVTWLNLYYPELAKHVPLCSPKDCDELIDGFVGLDDILTQDLKVVNDGLRVLKTNGN